MTQYAIATDLNRCVQCYACTVSCKVINGVPVGNYWVKVLRVGPNPRANGSGHFPDVEMYYLPVSCQHCENPECVAVCPTEASHKVEDGTIQIDKAKCIGCQFCVMACPYGVRYLNETERVVEKCTLCEQRTAQGEVPECVRQCGARARYFGDIEALGSLDGLEGQERKEAIWKAVRETFVGPPIGDDDDFGPITATTREFTADQIHQLPDVGNKPSYVYILRDRTWQGEE